MKIACIIVEVADIYKDHAFSSEVVTQALISEEVAVIDTFDNWSKVEQWDGYKGWINNFFLSEIIESDKSPSFSRDMQKYDEITLKSFTSDELRNKIISYCKELLGTPYKWGGKSRFGYDCSGLIQMSFKIHGISMPRDSKDQYRVLKKNKIKLSEAEHGDVLFFKENNRICHVGMFDKDFRFIHSSGMVKHNSLNEEDDLFDKKLMDKFAGVFSISGIIKDQLNERK